MSRKNQRHQSLKFYNMGEIIEAYADFKFRHGYYPKVIAIEGSGLLAVEENQKSARIVIDVFMNMLKVSFLSENFGGPKPMTQTQIDFINTWEVENFRRKLSKSC